MDWISFYDFKHSVIYVNERHRDVHYRTIAEDIAALVKERVPSREARVMDYGCGEATSAAIVADAGSHLTLIEAAPNVRAALKERYARNPKISVTDPDGAAAEAPASYDLVVMHSVAQYLTADEFDRLLGVFRRLVKPTGAVIIGDIVPPSFAAPAAAIALLRFGLANGFFWAAVGGLIRIFVSDYFKLKKTHGLSHYTQAQMLERLTRAGYTATRAAHNIGHNQQRMTFVATPSP